MSYLDDFEWEKKSYNLDLRPAITEDIELKLEVSSICNHACIFCPNKKISHKGTNISYELARRLMDEAENLGIRKIGLNMTGEPFAHPNLIDIICYAKKKGFSYIYMNTNGALPSERQIRSVIDSGIDSIKFSINAGKRETYKFIHGKDDFDKVISNLKFVSEYITKTGKKTKLLSSFVVTKYNINEIDEHYQNIIDYVDELAFFEVGSFGGVMIDEIESLKSNINNDKMILFVRRPNVPCNMLWKGIHVTAEGFLTGCCADAFNMLVAEDLHKMGIKEAWHSERMVNLRKMHLENKLEMTQCYKCVTGKDALVVPLNMKFCRITDGED